MVARGRGGVFAYAAPDGNSLSNESTGVYPSLPILQSRGTRFRSRHSACCVPKKHIVQLPYERHVAHTGFPRVRPVPRSREGFAGFRVHEGRAFGLHEAHFRRNRPRVPRRGSVFRSRFERRGAARLKGGKGSRRSRRHRRFRRHQAFGDLLKGISRPPAERRHRTDNPRVKRERRLRRPLRRHQA